MYILFLLGIILTIYAQFNVQRKFLKYSRIRNIRGITGSQAARLILDRNGLSNVRIEPIRGNLTDHYSPNENVLRLSQTVYNINSISAIAVASHEVGHALQDKDNYGPMRIRSFLVPIANIGSRASTFLLLIGLIFNMWKLFDLGIIFFSLALLFYIITLPVDINASSRALKELKSLSIIEDVEYKPAKKVLKAAALTYIASTLSAVFYLIRLIFIRNASDQ